MLIAIGGLSGSGKTSLARALQQAIPHTIHLDSDHTRKELFRVSAATRLPPEAYSPEATQRVIDETERRVKAHTAEGKNVIVSAVFLPPQSRLDQEKLAHAAGAGFAGLWMQADEAVLVERVGARINDASDAGADIVRAQLAEGAGVIGWPVIDAALPRDEIMRAALALIKKAAEK